MFRCGSSLLVIIANILDFYLIGYERDIISLEGGGSKVANGPLSCLCILQKEWDAFWKQGVLQSQQVHHSVFFFPWFLKSSQD
jgi:hypothetical protein